MLKKLLRSSSKFLSANFSTSFSTFDRPISSKVIGIDLGTTNSCVAVSDDHGNVTVIENEEGCRTTPSYVALDPKTETILVGDIAKRQSVLNPLNTFYATKRLIGRSFDDPTVQADNQLTSYSIVEHSNKDAWVQCEHNGQTYSPSQIGSFILGKMKEVAEDYLGAEVKDAVVTVPAYFNNSQKQATKDAGTIAGLNVRRIINEPTAAALAFGLDTGKEGLVAVFDMGGGTFDISILEITNLGGGEGNIFEVRSTNGDTHLGGEDFDHLISDYVINEFESLEGINLRGDAIAVQRIREEAETVKKELDHIDSATMSLPFIVVGDNPKNLEVSISREFFEEVSKPVIDRAIDPCRKALDDAGVTTKQVTEVLLVGGMTRMPKVQEMVMNFFGKKPNKQVNPDECVAIGAAIQGAILSKDVEGLLLVDVTPLSLGIETVGDTFSRLIEKNTSIPVKKSENFTTADDNQTSITVNVFQGEREIASKNKLLGSFNLGGIPPAPRGVPQVAVTFEMDENGILNVSAMDKATRTEAQITVQSSGGLTEEEIKAMIVEAEKFKEEDMKVRELVEKKNEADRIIDITVKAIRDLKDIITDSEESEARGLIAGVQEALRGDDDERIMETVENLKTVQMRLSEQAYKLKSGGESSSSDEFDDFDDLDDD